MCVTAGLKHLSAGFLQHFPALHSDGRCVSPDEQLQEGRASGSLDHRSMHGGQCPGESPRPTTSFAG